MKNSTQVNDCWDEDDDEPDISLDLLAGVKRPSGWEAKFVRLKCDGKKIESFQVRMPRANDGFRAFLNKRHLWDAKLGMPCAEYWAISDAQHAARATNADGQATSAKRVIGEIAYPACAQLDPRLLKRLIAAMRAVREFGIVASGASEMTQLYRTAFTACCIILRRLPTKFELTREVEEWPLRKKHALERGAPLAPHVIVYRAAKDDAARSRDRTAAGLDWLPSNHSSKGRRKG